MKKLLTYTLFILVCCSFADSGFTAKQLINSSKSKLALKNVHLALELVTTDNKDKSKTKELTVDFAEFGEQKKVKIEITAPDHVSGTKIITTDYPNKKGLIEIFVPATGKIQRIKANKFNMKIIGSEVPINQFSNIIGGDFNFKKEGIILIDDEECYKIKIENSESKSYGIAYISVQDQYLLRLEQYNTNNKLLKITELSDYIKITNSKDKYYPKHISVKNMRNSKSSRMLIREVKYLSQLNLEDFELTADL